MARTLLVVGHAPGDAEMRGLDGVLRPEEVVATLRLSDRTLTHASGELAAESNLAAVGQAARLAAPDRVVFLRSLGGLASDHEIHDLMSACMIELGCETHVVDGHTASRVFTICRRAAKALGGDWAEDVRPAHRRLEIRWPRPRPTREDLLARCGCADPRLRSADEVIAAIEEAQAHRRPLSMIRLNHCEPRLMGFQRYFFKPDVMHTFRMQWGLRNFPDDHIHDLADQMADAVREADILGVPRLRGEVAPRLTILEHSVYALGQELDLFRSATAFLDIRDCARLGLSERFFSLLSRSEKIVLLSGRDVSRRMHRRLGGKVPVVQLSLEAEWRKMDGTITEPQYPEGFYRVISELDRLVGPGVVVLVGAGIAGKIFCGEVKKRGGIALDLGSVFDAWAGLHTRGDGFPEGFELPPVEDDAGAPGPHGPATVDAGAPVPEGQVPPSGRIHRTPTESAGRWEQGAVSTFGSEGAWAEIAGRDAEIARLTDEIASIRQKRDARVRQLRERFEASRKRQDATVARLRAEVARLSGSRSWRLTAPFRAMTARAGRLLRREP